MALEIAVSCNRGKVRRKNEDVVAIGSRLVRDEEKATRVGFPDERFLVGVADGVGGAPGGDQASKIVAGQMLSRLEGLEGGLSPERLAEAVRLSAADVNTDLIKKSWLGLGRTGMSTTYTGVFGYEGALYCLHAGDSRLYRYGSEGLNRLTRDHTLREELGDPTIPGNIIVNCFGGEEQFYLDFFPIADLAANGDLLLLCSDGLSDMLSDPELEASCSELGPDLGEAARRFIGAANQAGGHDNISLALLRVVQS